MKAPFTKTKVRMLLASLFLVATGALGEDIDIYSQAPSVAERPNVLILIDNAASNDAAYASVCNGTPLPTSASKLMPMVQCGVYQAIAAIGNEPALINKLNVALLPYSGWWSPNPGPTNINGLTFMNTAGVNSMLATIAASMPKSNARAAPTVFQEAWALLNGGTGGVTGTTYPAPGASCAKSFIIFIGAAAKQGGPAVGNGNVDLSAAALGATTAQKTQISTAYLGAFTGNDGAWTDEWARFLRTTPGSARTYTIAAGGTSPDYVQHLQSVAKEGGGHAYVGATADDIKQALVQIFNEVQAVNSVFASSSLPVSVNAQGTYLNQIFMGMFRPDAAGAPRWFGNLKQFQFGVDTTNPAAPQLYLADSNLSNQPNLTYSKALSAAGTGFISTNAKSFWTIKDTTTSPDAPLPTGRGGFFANNSQGAGGVYDSPDGEIVEKGGVSQQMRLANLVDNYGTNPSSPRRLYTCNGTCVVGSSLSATPFATSNVNITAAALPSGSASRDTLIRWVRGEDNAGDELGPGGTINIRPSVHGDVLHSRPTVINYGGTTGIVVFYGANDGVFRAINGNNGLFKGTDGNFLGSIGSSPNVVPPGGELWGFIPTEFYSKLSRLRDNTPVVKFATTSTSIIPAPVSKDYFFDGPTGVYQNGTTAYIFMAARRGGRVIYALDVSDPTTPKLLWQKTNASVGFSELGQTWSAPTVGQVRGYTNPVLIFGAGYDPNEDSEPPTTDTMGRGIYILDAKTGSLLWRAGPGGSSNTCTVTAATAATTGCQLQKMVYAMPADITAVDRDFDGCIDRIYAADTGGNIWRVDLQAKVATFSGTCGDGIALTGAKPQDWQATLFASVGGASTDTTKRKFFFPPDVVVTKTFDIVLATTGDREHPLRTVSGATPTNAYAIYNKFYMIKDTNTGNDGSSGTAITDITSSTANLVDTTNFFDATSTPYDGTLKGFSVKLGNTGEKGVNAPTTIGGFTFFGTNQPVVPVATSCGPDLGTARGYRINFLTGVSKNVIFDGGGLPPSPVSGLVEVVINGVKTVEPFIIGGGNPDTNCVGPDCNSALGGLKPVIPLSGARKRAYWYQERDK